MKCPSCEKFASLELQDPEVNDITLNDDRDQVSYEVRIYRNSACCGDEMKEYTFTDDAEVPDEIAAKIKDILDKDPEAEFEAEEDSVDQLEESGHRYKKSYYGFTLAIAINVSHTTLELEPSARSLGTFSVSDKVQASGMDELN